MVWRQQWRLCYGQPTFRPCCFAILLSERRLKDLGSAAVGVLASGPPSKPFLKSRVDADAANFQIGDGIQLRPLQQRSCASPNKITKALIFV